jgi:hypothetical protein
MADEAGFRLIDPADYDVAEPIRRLGRFAQLIEEHLRFDGIHTCNDECQRPACVVVRKAVEREREACATLAEFNQSNHLEHLTAEQIRARGQS